MKMVLRIFLSGLARHRRHTFGHVFAHVMQADAAMTRDDE